MQIHYYFFWFKCSFDSNACCFKSHKLLYRWSIVAKHQSSLNTTDEKKTIRNKFVVVVVLLLVLSNWKSILTRYLGATNAAASNKTIYSPHSPVSSQSLLLGADGSRPCWVVTNQIRGQILNGIGGTFLDQFRHACERLHEKSSLSKSSIGNKKKDACCEKHETKMKKTQWSFPNQCKDHPIRQKKPKNNPKESFLFRSLFIRLQNFTFHIPSRRIGTTVWSK